MTETPQLEIVETDSPEAMEVMRKNNVLYMSDGQPVASLYFVFPDWNTITPKIFPDRNERRRACRLASALAKVFNDVDFKYDGEKEITKVMKRYKEFLNDVPDGDIAAVLNEAISDADIWFGHEEAEAVFAALGNVIDDDRFSGQCSTHYTYNDPDNYCGQHDIQITVPGDDFYPKCDILFLQIHPGGDARNMAAGLFYEPEGIDDHANLFDCLGTYATELGTTLEVPAEFPLEQFLREHATETWEKDIYHEEKQEGDRWVKSETLDRHDFKDGMCRVYLAPADENSACRVYGCYDLAAYKHNDFWDWVPTGTVVGQMRSSRGISATPWKPTEFTYSTGGYFKWAGPMPGTDAWKEMLEEYDLPVIEPHKPDNKDQKQLSL